MYGNVITNRQLRTLIESGCLSITPFEEKNLKAAAYTLSPGLIWKNGLDGELEVVHSFYGRRGAYALKANEYVVVEPRQRVVICRPGIIGTFITASTNVEKGLLVVAGQVDSLYGTNGEALRFGIKNLLNEPVELKSTTRLVHLQLIDMRGSVTDEVKPGKAVREVWESRRRDEDWAEHHAVNYDAARE